MVCGQVNKSDLVTLSLPLRDGSSSSVTSVIYVFHYFNEVYHYSFLNYNRTND